MLQPRRRFEECLKPTKRLVINLNYRAIGAVFLLSALPISAFAEDPSRSDDIALREAALAWLSGENATADLRAIGKIASAGNLLAQDFANKTYYRFVLSDYPELSRAEKLALFHPQAEGDRLVLRPYPLAVYYPQVLMDMSKAETPGEWIAGAQMLAKNGDIGNLLDQMSVTLANNPDLNIEAFQFSEPYIPDNGQKAVERWLFRGTEHSFLAYLDVSEPDRAAVRRERWGEPPWTPELEAAFSKALAEGRWSAINALGNLRKFFPDIQYVHAAPKEITTWADMAFDLKLESPPADLISAADELEALGQIIAKDALRSPYLQPLLNACEAACPDSAPLCVALGAISGIDREQLTPHLDPDISEDEYFWSQRAAQELLNIAGHWAVAVPMPPSYQKLPQCFKDAAIAAVK
jgi:hypothetical protein